MTWAEAANNFGTGIIVAFCVWCFMKYGIYGNLRGRDDDE